MYVESWGIPGDSNCESTYTMRSKQSSAGQSP